MLRLDEATQYEEGGLKSRSQGQRQLLFPQLGGPLEDQAAQLSHVQRAWVSPAQALCLCGPL